MSIIKKLIFIIFCFSNVLHVNAEPSPFGIKIKESTVSDIKGQYKSKDSGINKYSGGVMLDLEPTQLNFEGLQDISIVFGQDDKALAVFSTINKNRYQELLDMLSSKYTLVSKVGGFVGNSRAEFKDDNTKIVLDAPHLSFSMSLSYIHNDLNKKYIEESEKEKQQIKKQETEKL
jgi:hypothetical protein